MVIDFRTTEERHVETLAVAANEPDQGRPLPSRILGEWTGLSHHPALLDLHRAEEAGLVRSVRAQAGGTIVGWVPASVDASLPVSERKARRAAHAVREIYDGTPVSAAAVARHMEECTGTTSCQLRTADAFDLVCQTGSGWKPA